MGKSTRLVAIVAIAGLLAAVAVISFKIGAMSGASARSEDKPAPAVHRKGEATKPDTDLPKPLTGSVLKVDGVRYKTVQAAIDAAQRGDVVRLEKGVYDESLTLKGGIGLEGVDANSVIIQCDMRVAPVITISGCQDVQISGLTLRHHNSEILEERSEGRWAVVRISDSSAWLQRLVVCDGASHGISITNDRVHLDKVFVADCTVRNNRAYGISVAGNGNLTLRNSACVDNKRNGVCLFGYSDGEVSGNLCKGNGRNGISVADNATVQAVANTCSDNGWNGIQFRSKSPANARENVCSGNSYSGILVDGQVNLWAVGNDCRGNGINGIYVLNGVTGNVVKNTCGENQWHGISIDSYSHPTVGGNRCIGNKKCGIYDEGGMLEQNELRENGEFCKQEIQMHLRAGDFEELESLSARMRDQRLRFNNGNWQLDLFYRSFETGYGSQPYEDNIRFCESWLSQHPSSVTARVALAVSIRAQAWRTRGGGYARTVSPTAWEPFKEHLSRAHDVLKEAEALDVKDPGLYSEWITVATGLGREDDVEMAFRKGIEIEPAYYPLYSCRGMAHLPRWFGEPGQYEKFSAEAADSTKDQLGQSLYFLIARGLTYYVKTVDEFREAGLDFARIRQGQKDFAAQFPASVDAETANRMCFMACAAGDKEAARDYLIDMGDKWSAELWRDIETFEKYKAWAKDRTAEGSTSESQEKKED